MNNFKIIYGFKDVYNYKPQNDDFSLLKKYSTENILIKIAHINAIIFKSKNDDYDEQIIKEVFNSNIKIPLRESSCYQEKYNYFSSPHLSELIKESLNNFNESQSDSLTYNMFINDFFQTILIFNDKYNKKLNSENSLTSFKETFSLSILRQSHIRVYFFVYFLKFVFICLFLKNNEKYKELAENYSIKYGIIDIWNIASFLYNLYSENIQSDNIKYVVNKNDLPIEFLKELIINKDYILKKNNKELTLSFDIIPRPLFECNSDDTIILDFNFLQFTIDQGIFYKINNNSNDSAYLGKYFFEEFLCKSLFHKIFSYKDQIIHSSEKYQDFLIKTSSNNLLIIECKMTDVNPKTLENVDFEKFKETVESNFLSQKTNKTNKTNKTKNKGVYQILRQLEQINDKKNYNEITDILKIKKIKNLNIYPIILTNDTNYNILGTNNYINEKCRNDFNNLKNYYKSINPVIIININTIIEYCDYFNQNKKNFTDLIKSYFKYINDKKKKYSLNNNNSIDYINSSISFDTYLFNKINNKSMNSIINHFKDEISSLNKNL